MVVFVISFSINWNNDGANLLFGVFFLLVWGMVMVMMGVFLIQKMGYDDGANLLVVFVVMVVMRRRL